MDDLIKLVARALAAADGYNPDETWEEFDRTAAHSGAPDSDVFRVVARWEEYRHDAQAILDAINREHVILPIPKPRVGAGRIVTAKPNVTGES